MNEVRPDRAHLVEQLVAGVGAARQALLGQQHAGLRGLAVAHQHLGAFGIHVERDARFLQRRADPADVLRGRARCRASPAPGRLR